MPDHQWEKAMRSTGWAQESLSGPVCHEDLVGHVASCLHSLACLFLAVSQLVFNF